MRLKAPTVERMSAGPSSGINFSSSPRPKLSVDSVEMLQRSRDSFRHENCDERRNQDCGYERGVVTRGRSDEGGRGRLGVGHVQPSALAQLHGVSEAVPFREIKDVDGSLRESVIRLNNLPWSIRSEAKHEIDRRWLAFAFGKGL